MSWQSEKGRVERRLYEFLGLHGTGLCVIYFNRAASAMGAVMRYLWSNWAIDNVKIERPTFHAAERIAKQFGLVEEDSDKLLYIPVALGGEVILWPGSTEYLLYDCCQTCYPNMFKGVEFKYQTQFAVLSFQENKPYGSPSGGGALVCRGELREYFNKVYLPGGFYFNPRAGQCAETSDKLACCNGCEIQKTMTRFLMERERLMSIGLQPFNGRISWDPMNRFTHMYVYNHDGLDLKDLQGYTPYAEDKLLRKELR